MIDRFLLPLLIALAVVLLGSLSFGAKLHLEVDPHVAFIEWSDGTTEEVHVQNLPLCMELAEKIRGRTWVPVNRSDVTLSKITCRPGGPIPGGSCIVGRGGNC